MRNQILHSIKNNWYEEILPGIKMKDFFKQIYTVFSILSALKVDHSYKVGLFGERSFNWIAIYIATLLKGCSLVVVPHGMSKREVKHYLNVTEVNYLFIDSKRKKCVNLQSIPFLKAIFNINNFTPVITRVDVHNLVLATTPITVDQIPSYELKDIEELFKVKYTNDVITVITPTSATEWPNPKYVQSTASSIESLIIKSIDLLPYDLGDLVFSNVDFASSHYLSVLMPFIKGCIITDDLYNADVVIEDTKSFEKVWRDRVDSILENPILDFIFSGTIFRHLFSNLAVRRLKRHYNQGTKTKKIILYNNTVSERILDVVRGKLPLWATYGSQECNQLIAYNDYSSTILRQPNCVGHFIRGFEYKVQDSELFLQSKSMFICYYGDEFWTNHVMNTIWYSSGDSAFIDNDRILFVYGRMKSIYTDKIFNFPIQLDNMERVINGNPYFKEVQVYPSIAGLELSVILDTAFIESKRIGLLKLQKVLKEHLKLINNGLASHQQLTRIETTDYFPKTFDGKIKRIQLLPYNNH